MTTDLRGLQPQHPTLYQLAPDGESLEFLFAQCPACRKLVFPADVPGCSHCGDPLHGAEKVARPGGGKLLEYVTLHVPLLPGMEVPRIAADILIEDGLIEDGLIEEGVIAGTDESALRVGMALRAVGVAQPGGETFACRFVPVEGAAR